MVVTCEQDRVWADMPHPLAVTRIEHPPSVNMHSGMYLGALRLPPPPWR